MRLSDLESPVLECPTDPMVRVIFHSEDAMYPCRFGGEGTSTRDQQRGESVVKPIHAQSGGARTLRSFDDLVSGRSMVEIAKCNRVGKRIRQPLIRILRRTRDGGAIVAGRGPRRVYRASTTDWPL